MFEALSQVGLPVKCRHCDKSHMVKPGTDYDGWSKSKVSKKWSCPEHSAEGMDESFRRRYAGNTQKEIYSEAVEYEPDDLQKLMDLID